MEIVVHLFFDEIPHKFIDTHATKRKRLAIFILIGSHGERAEFDFCLRFKHRFYHANGDSSHKTITHILNFIVLTEILFDRACDVFLKSTLVRTTLCGVLTIDERVIFLAILSSVRKSYVDILTFQVDDRIKSLRSHIVGEEVF